MRYFEVSFSPAPPRGGFWVGSAGFQSCSSLRKIPLEHQGEFRIICLVSGEGKLTGSGRDASLSPGDLFVSFPGEKAPGILSGCLEYSWIGLCGEEAPALLDLICTGHDSIQTICWPDEFLVLALQIKNTDSNEAAGALQRQSLAYSLLSRLVQSERASPNIRFSHAETAIRFLREHYRQPITIADVAQHVGVSRSWLYQCFMAYLEQPPAQYLRDLRISQAKALLVHTVMSVQEVAYAVGFLDPLYFSKVFSACVGLPPKRFRNLRAGIPEAKTDRSRKNCGFLSDISVSYNDSSNHSAVFESKKSDCGVYHNEAKKKHKNESAGSPRPPAKARRLDRQYSAKLPALSDDTASVYPPDRFQLHPHAGRSDRV